MRKGPEKSSKGDKIVLINSTLLTPVCQGWSTLEKRGIIEHHWKRCHEHIFVLLFQISLIVLVKYFLKPAIHLSLNWRECEKMLAKREKREVYRWHFVNHPANHFSHLTFRHSHQMIDIFTKCQGERQGKFLVKFLAESKRNEIDDIVRIV